MAEQEFYNPSEAGVPVMRRERAKRATASGLQVSAALPSRGVIQMAWTLAATIVLAIAPPLGHAHATEALDARQAGARHGQALGVALVCYGLKTTPKVEALAAGYQGADAEAFRAESEKVLLSWQDAKSCKKAGGPNECRLIFEWSCRDALKEIGPEGSKLPGLVDSAR